MNAFLQHCQAVMNLIMKSAVWTCLMRLPICKIIYCLLKLSIIDYVSPKKECEIFFFYIDMRKKFCLCGGIVSCRWNFVIDSFLICWKWFAILTSNVAASIFTTRGSIRLSNYCVLLFKGTLMQIWKSIYIFVLI